MLVSITAPVCQDLRTFPVLYGFAGYRMRPFGDAVSLLYEAPFANSPVDVPRTVLWLLSQLLITGMSSVQRHFWWRQALGISASDSGVDEH